MRIAVSFRMQPLMVMALTWNLFLFPVSLAGQPRKALSILYSSHDEEDSSSALCFGFLRLHRIDYPVLFSGRSYNNCIDCLSFDS